MSRLASELLYGGAPGLLLSTPITACLVVLGRHVESLNFIELLLGDKPPLSPVQSFYQRILASDPDEVIFQAEALLKDLTLLDYYEQVALPGLALAQIDVVRGVMDRSRQAEICASVESVVADLSDHVDVADEEVAQAAPQVESLVQIERSLSGAALCLAGRTPIDQAACAILAQLVERERVAARVLGPELPNNQRGVPPRSGRRRGALHFLSRPPELSCGPIFGTPAKETISRRANRSLLVGQR